MNTSKEELLRKALGATNPFAFRMPGAEMEFFKSPFECYRDVILMLWAEFPRGFIDIPYFMSKYQGVNIREAARQCGQKQYALVELWQSGSQDRNTSLRRVLEKLLKVTGVDFDENAYVNALQAFDAFLETSKIPERTVSGALVKFINK